MEVTPIFSKNRNSTAKIVINRGGTRSSKSYSIMQLCALWLMTGECGKNNYIDKGVWSVVRKFRTTIDSTILRDFDEILQLNGWEKFIEINKTKKTYKYQSRLVEFIGADDEQKLRGAKRNILYCNEANELNYKQEFFQLLMRTTDKIFIDFNPDDPNIWINTELEQKRKTEVGDVDVIVSSYKDNTFLPASLVKEIELLQATDDEFWKIYGLGEYGNISGLVFKNVKRLRSNIINDKTPVALGLDFGFTNDPTAIVELYQIGDDVVFNELVYESGLTNQDIAKKIKSFGYKRVPMYCDSAEPKSIEELKRSGIKALPTVKGKDSIKIGIDLMKSYSLAYTDNSANLGKEFNRYKWKQDKTGNSLNVPIDMYNHAIDACRYVATMVLTKKNSTRYSFK